MSETRASRARTRSSPRHEGDEHQHCVDVRTGDTWSPASERANDALQWPRSAFTSSSETKFSKLTTQGSRLSTWGLNSGKSRTARSNMALRLPASSFSACDVALRSHDFRISAQVWHETGQDVCMYTLFLLHSPCCAHVAHCLFSSLQSSDSTVSACLTATGGSGGARAVDAHVPHESGHEMDMKRGLAAHSPEADHAAQNSEWSMQGVSEAIAARVVSSTPRRLTSAAGGAADGFTAASRMWNTFLP
mmetsp:Transcript_27436/g.73825  ORF Transcript_27436/g.73825 Transcript_27436/m.73825 type:complete len:248 (-) Transcript_27436:185-928(-)